MRNFQESERIFQISIRLRYEFIPFGSFDPLRFFISRYRINYRWSSRCLRSLRFLMSHYRMYETAMDKLSTIESIEIVAIFHLPQKWRCRMGSDRLLPWFYPFAGKSHTMLGTPEAGHTLGAIPCAIAWLFRGISEQRQRTGARFSVRVSCVELTTGQQQLRDLLAAHANGE